MAADASAVWRWVDEPSWLDAQYNNRARIAEHPQIFARWASDSAQARKALSPWVNLRYGDGADETLDLFEPSEPNQPGAPVLVFIHGGWWRSLDKADHSFIAPAFVQRGAMVVVPNYSLCPAVTIDHIVMQMVRALAWTYRRAAAYGGDPQRIVVVGHSAGGHLAAMLLACHWQAFDRALPARLVKGALAISGLFDLAPVQRTPFLKADLQLPEAAVPRLSPAYFAAARGPLYAAAGALESEEFLRQTCLIRHAWGARCVPVCETVAGCNHLDVLHTLADADGALHARAQELLGSA
jgi:arylformamidase